MDVSTSGGVNCFRYFKRGLIKWYRFRFERKSLKNTILFITSGDDRKWRTTALTPLCTSTKWDLSSLKIWYLYLVSFLRKRVDMKRGQIKWYRFRFERKCLKITILFITSGDDRKWRTTPLTPLCTSTKWDLSSLKVWWLYLISFLRKRVDMKKRKSAVSHDRKWFFKK